MIWIKSLVGLLVDAALVAIILWLPTPRDVKALILLVAMMIAMAVNLFARLRSAQPFPELPKMPSSRVNMETREVVLITAALMFPLAVLLILFAIFRR
jgi:hypothetical protein